MTGNRAVIDTAHAQREWLADTTAPEWSDTALAAALVEHPYDLRVCAQAFG